jgi:hypothetical protein
MRRKILRRSRTVQRLTSARFGPMNSVSPRRDSAKPTKTPNGPDNSSRRTLFVVSKIARVGAKLGYLFVDKRGADLLFQGVATRRPCGSIVVTAPEPSGMGSRPSTWTTPWPPLRSIS